MDTITRYMDQDLNRTELDLLADALRDDRELAAEFARAARLDQALEETFAEAARESELAGLIAMLELQDAPPTKLPRNAILWAATAAAAIALCFTIIHLWQGDRAAGQASSASSKPASKRIQRPSVHLPQTRLTAILPRDGGTDAEAEDLLRQRLSRFYLPQTSIDELPLDEALAALQQAVYNADQLGWTADEPVAFEVARSHDDAGPLPKVSLLRPNISALNALNLLALQGGHELAFSPPKVKLVPKPPSGAAEDGAGESSTRTYTISTRLLASGPYYHWVPAVFSPEGTIVSTPSSDGATLIWDSASGDYARIQNQLAASARGQLKQYWGLKLADAGSSATYNPATSELVLAASPADHERFATLLSEANGTSASSAPITISTKLITLPDELAGMSDRIVNAEEWQQILRDWSQQRGVDLMAAPSITTHIGQEVSAQIMTYPSVEVNQEGVEGIGEIDVEGRTGLSLPFTTSATGEQITVSGSIDQSIAEADLAPEVLERLGGSDPDLPIVHFITEVEAPLFPGQVALFECESHEPGRRLLASVSVDWGAKQQSPSASESEPTPDTED